MDDWDLSENTPAIVPAEWIAWLNEQREATDVPDIEWEH